MVVVSCCFVLFLCFGLLFVFIVIIFIDMFLSYFACIIIIVCNTSLKYISEMIIIMFLFCPVLVLSCSYPVLFLLCLVLVLSCPFHNNNTVLFS